MNTARITVAKGDGVGPEIMDATLKILEAVDAQLEIDEVQIGKEVYLQGHSSGISPEAMDTIRKNKVFLKAPITTPQGGGYKSLNVSIRKLFGLYANVRPAFSLSPYVASKHPEMDVVIIRENEEDLYAGIEHQQTDEVVQCLKLMSRPGCEKIIRYAFEYARAHKRKKVSCFTKDNIMKQTDGLFHKVFDEVKADYPEIETDHWIIDIGAARLSDTPERFDVIVTLNLYGDVLSDIAAQIAGSVGLAGSANIGEELAMFEAIHGTAPDIAGKNEANPSGLLQAAVQMLHYLGQNEAAEKITNAWLRTLEEGIHTPDVYREGVSVRKVGTREFAESIIECLGQEPTHLKAVHFPEGGKVNLRPYVRKQSAVKELLGTDVFIHWEGNDANAFGDKLSEVRTPNLSLQMVTNRGVKVWPHGIKETFCTDHWRCRFEAKEPVKPTEIIALLQACADHGFEVIKTENLYRFDGVRSYSLGQGQ